MNSQEQSTVAAPRKKLRTFYIASHTGNDEDNMAPKKCCISLPPYIWDIFQSNLEAATTGSRKMTASCYFRRLLRKYLLSEGVRQNEINNEWDAFRAHCDERGKTYVSMMQKIICDAHNAVNTIMDMGVERLHCDLFDRTYSDEFNERLMRVVDDMSEIEKRGFNSDYSTTSVQIPCNVNHRAMDKISEKLSARQ